jgi:hypothetical protein
MKAGRISWFQGIRSSIEAFGSAANRSGSTAVIKIFCKRANCDAQMISGA